MIRKKICVANWKMNKNFVESNDFLKKITQRDLSSNSCELVICPSYDSLFLINKFNSQLSFGSQDVSYLKSPSSTGEISVDMLTSHNCKYVIIGHSERRESLNETNESVSLKMKEVYDSEMIPILCIGETLDEKLGKLTDEILEQQVKKAFSKIDFKSQKDILIAYEPVWAIGTGQAAGYNEIKENMKLIKKIINNIYTNNCNIYLLYGGSVNENNASEIINIDNVDGFLIGSASLEVDSFYKIFKQL